MIKVEKLSYSFPTKDLYNKVSFSIEENQHAVLIGSNGTGKTTLVQILMNPDEFLYDGKVKKNIEGRIGYVSQLEKAEKDREITVFDFLAEDFVQLQTEMEAVCTEMETAEDFDVLMERYQQLLDESMAMDVDHYESNIHKELKTAGLSELADLSISVISGGEYKLLQVIRQMLKKPALLIMDEPDAFLDFGNLTGLKNLINSYQGTLLVITHNRYLLNHCFDKILHLEGADIQEFEGNFIEYNFALLAKKIELQELSAKQQEEIERSRKVVERMRGEASKFANASLGRALHAKVSYLERLEARKIKDPFVDLRQPEIVLPMLHESKLFENEVRDEESAKYNLVENNLNENELAKDVLAEGNSTKSELEKTQTMESGLPDCNLTNDEVAERESVEKKLAENELTDVNSQKDNQEPATVLTVNDYTISFEDTLLENISFTLKANEKVAIVGGNGTGKTTLLHDIFENKKDSIWISPDVELGFLSQIHGDMLNENHTVYEEMEEIGEGSDTSVAFENRKEIEEYLAKYCFEEDMLSNKLGVLSGGEKNLLQLAKIERSHAGLLLLDEPTSHLDTYAQLALEKAIAEYEGAVLMVCHDFYTIVNCADYVLFVEDKGIRKMRIRSFRKMIYEDHFKMEYLELDQKKKELEQRIDGYLLKHDFESARSVCEQLEEVVTRMKSKM